MEYFKNFREFDLTFANDETCLRFLEQVRWGKEFKCQKCGTDKYSTMATGLRRCQACRFKNLPRKSAAANPDELLPGINSVTAHLKRWLLGTLHGRLDPQHMTSYFEEFVFRFNRRTSKARGQLFQRVLENSIRVEPAPYRKISARNL